MALNDFFKKGKKGISSGGEVIIDGSTSGTGGVEIHEVFASGAINMYKEIDTTEDGVFNLSVPIESVESGNGPIHSQKNQIEVSDNENVRLRVVNNSKTSIDCAVNGIEVSN